MQQTEFKTIVISADEGHFLTQVGDVPISERLIATTIAIGRNDSAENYIEIDKQTADEYLAAIDEYNKQQHDDEQEN